MELPAMIETILGCMRLIRLNMGESFESGPGK
jgi:hypothetical protein